MSSRSTKQRGKAGTIARREFLTMGFTAGLAALVAGSAGRDGPAQGAAAAADKRDPAADDRLRIDCAGQRYQAVVPDTLDLAERAALAVNALGGTSDPAMGGLHYFNQFFVCRPPYMNHHGADTTCTPKYMESFPMMRLMCGSDRYAELELMQRQMLVAQIADGLYWNRYRADRPWATSYNPAFDGQRKTEDLANVGGNGRMLRALVTCYELDPQPHWEARIRELVGGLRRIAIHRDDYSYYPDGGFGEPFNYPRSGWIRTEEPKSEIEGGEGAVTAYQGHQIQGLARWYRLSRDKDALDLAVRLARFCMLPKFWGGLPDPQKRQQGVGHVVGAVPDPFCISGAEQGHWFSHFHARAIALRGILECGMAVEDPRILEFVQRAYEYTWTLGIPRMGWVNCYPGALNLCEGCALGDLVALGIRLTDAGLGDYWDAVDAVVRNQLAEQQLIRADLLERISAAGPERPKDKRSPHSNQELNEGVIPRSLGIFGGTASPTAVPNTSSMTCCTSNATQGLYYAWEGAVRASGEGAQVNLLLATCPTRARSCCATRPRAALPCACRAGCRGGRFAPTWPARLARWRGQATIFFSTASRAESCWRSPSLSRRPRPATPSAPAPRPSRSTLARSVVGRWSTSRRATNRPRAIRSTSATTCVSPRPRPRRLRDLCLPRRS